MRWKSVFLTVSVLACMAAPAAYAASSRLNAAGEGRRVWLKLNCYSCHGNNAAGGMGPNIQGAETGDVTSAMLQGDAMEGGMRSFAKYATQTDARNVAAYLQSIGTPQEPKWLDWWNANP